MSYELIISESAKADLKNIIEYISYQLHAPEAGKKLIRSMLGKIHSLCDMPKMYKMYPNEPLRSKNIRYIPVAKYVIFYKILEDSQKIYISRVMYGGRNIAEQSIDVIED